MDDPVNTKLPSYEVHHAGAEATLRKLGRLLKQDMPPGFGFTLFIYEYGDEVDKGSMFYLSSSHRQDMLKVLKEFIAKQEKEQNAGA